MRLYPFSIEPWRLVEIGLAWFLWYSVQRNSFWADVGSGCPACIPSSGRPVALSGRADGSAWRWSGAVVSTRTCVAVWLSATAVVNLVAALGIVHEPDLDHLLTVGLCRTPRGSNVWQQPLAPSTTLSMPHRSGKRFFCGMATALFTGGWRRSLPGLPAVSVSGKAVHICVTGSGRSGRNARLGSNLRRNPRER